MACIGHREKSGTAFAIAFASQEFSRAGRALESGLVSTQRLQLLAAGFWLIVVISSVLILYLVYQS